MVENRRDLSLEHLHLLLTDEQGKVPSTASVEQTEAALIALTRQQAKQPSAGVKSRILDKLKKMNFQAVHRQPFTLDNLPLLKPNSNWLDWEAAVRDIPPPDVYENIHLHPLESNEKRDLFIAWVQEFIPEEVHHDVLESFILLDGTCDCWIWGAEHPTQKRKVRMQAGDFLEMKIGEIHDIQITSPQPVRAILQWLKMPNP
jgi:mannose-6-phosphate isomerase-like protein (cupin superfamily)